MGSRPILRRTLQRRTSKTRNPVSRGGRIPRGSTRPEQALLHKTLQNGWIRLNMVRTAHSVRSRSGSLQPQRRAHHPERQGHAMWKHRRQHRAGTYREKGCRDTRQLPLLHGGNLQETCGPMSGSCDLREGTRQRQVPQLRLS